MDCNNDVSIIDLSDLKSDKFLLIIPNAPNNLTWKISSVELPSISVDSITLKNDHFSINTHGDTKTYSDLTCTFSISSDLKNYLFLNYLLNREVYDNYVPPDYIDLIFLDVNDKPKSYGIRCESYISSLSGISFNVSADEGSHEATATFTVNQWYFIDKGSPLSLKKYLQLD